MVVFLPPTRKDILSLLAGAELYLSTLGTGLDLVLILAMFELYHPLLLGVFIGT